MSKSSVKPSDIETLEENAKMERKVVRFRDEGRQSRERERKHWKVLKVSQIRLIVDAVSFQPA